MRFVSLTILIFVVHGSEWDIRKENKESPFKQKADQKSIKNYLEKTKKRKRIVNLGEIRRAQQNVLAENFSPLEVIIVGEDHTEQKNRFNLIKLAKENKINLFMEGGDKKICDQTYGTCFELEEPYIVGIAQALRHFCSSDNTISIDLLQSMQITSSLFTISKMPRPIREKLEAKSPISLKWINCFDDAEKDALIALVIALSGIAKEGKPIDEYVKIDDVQSEKKMQQIKKYCTKLEANGNMVKIRDRAFVQNFLNDVKTAQALPNFMIVGDDHREGVQRILEEKTKYKVKTWPVHDRIQYAIENRPAPKGGLEEQAKFDEMLKINFGFKETEASAELSALQARNEMRAVHRDGRKTDEQVVGEWYRKLSSELWSSEDWQVK